MKLCRHLLVNWCRFRWLISEQRSFNWFVYVDLINVLSAFALFRFSLYRALALALPSQFSIDSIQTDKHTQTIYFIQWVKFGLIFFSPHYQFDKSILSVFFSVLDDFKLSTMALLRFIHLFVLCVSVCALLLHFSFLSLALSIHKIQDMITIQAKVKLSILLCVLNQRNQDIRYSSHLLFWLSQSRSSSSSSINKHTITFDTRIHSSSS